jgi:hypothetical protein
MHGGHGPAGAGHTLKPRRMTLPPVLAQGSKGHRAEAPPRGGVTLGGGKRLGSGPSRRERGRHPTAARQVVTTPRRAAGSPVVSDWLRHYRCTADNNILTP